ncbi:hypothetical protein JOD02_001276 [Caldicoprobacter guelmensis]|nr:hypothetical protein [Caldicoprobacter guelmensis]
MWNPANFKWGFFVNFFVDSLSVLDYDISKLFIIPYLWVPLAAFQIYFLRWESLTLHKSLSFVQFAFVVFIIKGVLG